ncbi:hypothetical protein ACFOTA_01495 [Chitinophaga sp. GCM10012297]|uniref:Uncharacterized protein n=1 Tax=Chitinophaga chungangae TaxID=2821488 RepID=A0ABS3Y865_9BACT|nr:hypothetical protein [Chitinophaga chungangae]MBO9150867.1 hypothetical protein [Chitinophaga chungangae]
MSPYLKATLIPVVIVSTAAALYFDLSFFLRDDYAFGAYLPGCLFTISYLIVKCCSVPLGFNRVRTRLAASFALYTIFICLYHYPLWWSFFDRFRDNDFMHVFIIITLTEFFHTYREYFFGSQK